MILHFMHHAVPAIARVAISPPVVALTSRRKAMASVFMLHRFEPAAGGHELTTVRNLLGWVRRNRFEVLDLETLLRRLAGDGPTPRRAIAFTIDDGYRCQAQIGAPIFAEFDAPVTTFLTTGFLDGETWLWWDRIEYVLRRTDAKHLLLPATGRPREFPIGPAGERHRTIEAVTEYCKKLPDRERHKAIAQIIEQAGITIPSAPPPEYAPMTWEEARRCEAGGMRFGPHTVTHPILARTDDDQARYEIEVSWQRLKAELSNPVPVFGYPNGRSGDFGPREIAILRRLGFLGAVSAEAGYASDPEPPEGDRWFRVPRFSFSRRHSENLRYASGLERLWRKVRRLGR